MKRSIFSEIFSGYFFIIVLLSSLIFVFSFKTIRNYYIETLASHLKNLGMTIEKEVKPLMVENNFKQMDAFVKKLGKEIHTRITIIDTDGVVLADSEKHPELMENHRGRPEVKSALIGKTGRSLRFSSTVEEEMLYVALPVKEGDKIIGVIRTSFFLKDINNLLATLKKRMFQILLIMTVFSILIAFLFSRGLSLPVRNLASAARKVASGNFNVTVSLRRNKELMELANSFNYMTERMNALFKDLSLKTEELNSIISSLQEGIMVMNEEGKIILSNESFKRIVDDDEPEGKYWWEVVRSTRLNEFIKKGFAEKKGATEEITLGEKTFLCNITFVPSMREMALSLHDITEIKRLERMKRDFVVNVSHELRTPLTAIKGFVETLDEEIGEEHREYLDIIKKHTDRLINIVEDLLILSKLEVKNAELEMEKVDLKSLIQEVLILFRKRIEDKGLFLELDLDEVPTIQGDTFKLEQMLVNLIDNAIKYTDKGGIEISLKDGKNYVKIGVKDTGIGIPREDIERIFERFYVVDKSRSRKLGGTGLGLSIVKHIVLLHNGKIEVESTPGKGTKFTILLPINVS